MKFEDLVKNYGSIKKSVELWGASGKVVLTMEVLDDLVRERYGHRLDNADFLKEEIPAQVQGVFNMLCSYDKRWGSYKL